MGMISKKIVQTRVWIDPTKPKPAENPGLNYEQTYPITTYEAVKETWDDDARTLGSELHQIQQDLLNKQQIFPGKPANYIMTFAGAAGAVGSVKMTQKITWDINSQRHDRIPTEKAIGEYLLKIGMLDENGNPTDVSKPKWYEIIGRPQIYHTIGDNADGVMTQKAVTKEFDGLRRDMQVQYDVLGDKDTEIITSIDKHNKDFNNPHRITPGLIGAATNDFVLQHTNDTNNPHRVNRNQLGLDKVDNTPDIDKPISRAALVEFDKLRQDIAAINNDIDDVLTGASYDMTTGKLTLAGPTKSLVIDIPISGLIDEVRYDETDKCLKIYELSGTIKKISVEDLYIRYVGTDTSTIHMEHIEHDDHTYQLRAWIIDNSITEPLMADNSVSNRTIVKNAITNDKLANDSVDNHNIRSRCVTTDKIAIGGILNENLSEWSVSSKKLFTSSTNDRILAVHTAGQHPEYMQANTDMIADGAITTKNYHDRSITTMKLADNAITAAKLDNMSVETRHLTDRSVLGKHLAIDCITSEVLGPDLIFKGTPKIETQPTLGIHDSTIVTSYWTIETLKNYVFNNANLADNIIDSRTLLGAASSNKALLTFAPNTDPKWATITSDFIGDKAVTNRIIDTNAVTGDKLANLSVSSRTIVPSSIKNIHMDESAVESDTIFKSRFDNMILAAIAPDSHPIYTKLNREMIPHGLIGTNELEDGSVKLNKIDPSYRGYEVLTVMRGGRHPEWSKIRNELISDHAVDGRTLFSSSIGNTVLMVGESNTTPYYGQINSLMIQNKAIRGHNIDDDTILGRSLAKDAVTGRVIKDYTIDSHHIKERSIRGNELFTSAVPNRVLCVADVPYSNARWMQINKDMIEDKAITREKIFRSEYNGRVLAVTKAGVPPEYLKITSDFIVDDSIKPEKLTRDFVLYGTPRLTVDPPLTDRGESIASTRWVWNAVSELIKNFNPGIMFHIIDSTMIKPHSITPDKFFTSPIPGVLAVLTPNGDPQYTPVTEGLIEDGAITSMKIRRDVMFPGSPSIGTRPIKSASDQYGGGNLIPDCQWVLDAIRSTNTTALNYNPAHFMMTPDGLSINFANIYATNAQIDALFGNPGGTPGGSSGSSGGVGGSGGPITPGMVETIHIANRAVTGEKLFVSTVANCVLACTDPHTDPKYVKINHDMLEANCVHTDNIMKSPYNNKVLGAVTAGSKVEFITIKHDMIDDGAVGETKIASNAITSAKIASQSVLPKHIFSSTEDNRVLGVSVAGMDPEYLKITGSMIEPNSITYENLQNDSIDGTKLKDQSVTKSKLALRAVIDTIHLTDGAVTGLKIKQDEITSEHIKVDSVHPNRIMQGEEFNPFAIKADTDDTLNQRRVRNTIISTDPPTGGEPGDIWFRII